MNLMVMTGRLGKDVEVGSGNVEQAKFSIFIETYSGGEKGGFWLNCIHFKPNQFLKDTLKKGTKVTVSGRLDINEYNGKWYTKMITHTIEPEVRHGDSPNQERTTTYSEVPVDDDLPF